LFEKGEENVSVLASLQQLDESLLVLSENLSRELDIEAKN
jgi:hypothetical protein